MPEAAPLRDSKAAAAACNARILKARKDEATALVASEAEEGCVTTFDDAFAKVMAPYKLAQAGIDAKWHATGTPNGGSQLAGGWKAAKGGPNTVAFVLAQEAAELEARARKLAADDVRMGYTITWE